MSLSEKVLLMKKSLNEVEEHLSKLQNGRKASSAKARASLMSLKKNSHQLRSDITKFTKELPTKKRTKPQDKVEEIADVVLENIEVDEPVAIPVDTKTEKKPKKVRTPKKKDA